MKQKRGYFASNMYKRTANGSLVHAKQMMRKNELCHCGSGKKFKRCHGNISLLLIRRGPLKGYGFFITILILFFTALAIIYSHLN